MSRQDFPWKPVAVSGALAFVGTVLVATVVNRSTSPGTPAPRRIALIGDSYAVGLGPELAKLLPIFQFEGHVGTSTAQWASHEPGCGMCGNWLTTFHPDIVLVALGVNDGNAPNSTNYQAIVRELHGIGARVVWIEPPAGVNTPTVRNVIASLGVSTVAATTTPLAADGLHPWSYAPWADEIAAAISR